MEMLLPASSSEGSRISQVVKLCWQKYQHGMPSDFKSSSKVSRLILASLLVLKSVMMLDRGFGSTSVTPMLEWEVSPGAYFLTLSFTYCCMDQETGVLGLPGLLCPGWMELAGSEDCLFTWEASSDGHSDLMWRVLLPALRLLGEGFQIVSEEIL